MYKQVVNQSWMVLVDPRSDITLPANHPMRQVNTNGNWFEDETNIYVIFKTDGSPERFEIGMYFRSDQTPELMSERLETFRKWILEQSLPEEKPVETNRLPELKARIQSLLAYVDVVWKKHYAHDSIDSVVTAQGQLIEVQAEYIALLEAGGTAPVSGKRMSIDKVRQIRGGIQQSLESGGLSFEQEAIMRQLISHIEETETLLSELKDEWQSIASDWADMSMALAGLMGRYGIRITHVDGFEIRIGEDGGANVTRIEASAVHQQFKKDDPVVVIVDKPHAGWHRASGIVLDGDDAKGYHVGFTDILAPDEFPVHVFEYRVDELAPAPPEVWIDIVCNPQDITSYQSVLVYSKDDVLERKFFATGDLVADWKSAIGYADVLMPCTVLHTLATTEFLFRAKDKYTLNENGYIVAKE